MTVVEEGDLRVEFRNVTDVRKFDGSDHGLSHCMKAVDYVVERSDCYLFIEFKDPQNPQSRDRDRKGFIDGFLRGELDSDLKYKYRDSFLYEWASGRAEKPINYLVLIAADTLTDAELTTRTDALKRELPLEGPNGSSWTRPIATSCAVFNIDSWNRMFSEYPISRLSDSGL